MNKFVMRQSLLLLLTATIWGVAFVAQSVGMDYIGPFTFNVVRNVIGGLVLIPCIAVFHRTGAKEEDAGKTPGSRKNGTARLGGGAAIKILDHSVIAHSDVVKHMEQTAAEHHIAVQRDIMLSGGTDGGAIHVTRRGVRTGGISIPCRYVHSPVEKVSIQDLEACVRLAAAFAQADLPR